MDAAKIISIKEDYKNGKLSLTNASLALVVVGLKANEVILILNS